MPEYAHVATYSAEQLAEEEKTLAEKIKHGLTVYRSSLSKPDSLMEADEMAIMLEGKNYAIFARNTKELARKSPSIKVLRKMALRLADIRAELDAINRLVD